MIKHSKISSSYTQYIFESSAWMRLIDFFHRENSFLKTRLSEVLEEIEDRDNLAMAEHFQNQFIIKDDVYDHMKHDINRHMEKWKVDPFLENSTSTQALKKTHAKLKEQVDYIERDHSILRKDYNTYLMTLSKKPIAN